MSYKGHRVPPHRVCGRRLNADDPAAHDCICEALLLVGTVEGSCVQKLYQGPSCTCSVDACTVGLEAQQ